MAVDAFVTSNTVIGILTTLGLLSQSVLADSYRCCGKASATHLLGTLRHSAVEYLRGEEGDLDNMREIDTKMDFGEGQDVAEVVNVLRESFPPLRLIGKRYTDADRGSDGGYSQNWGEWFEKGYFAVLEQLEPALVTGDAYVGCMRCCAGEFEYWIGMFFPDNTPVPDGYTHVDIPAGDVGICWIYGRHGTGELYGQEAHDMCMAKIQEAGWQIADEPWLFELYNCPRFTAPDAKGNVILDYGVYLR